jgi:prepilin-type N-terminal cleavage/methylation domain-containing protein
MDSALPPTRRARAQGGFTLLEVMLAFAILALAVGLLTQIWAHNIEKAIAAIDQREMRELADTVFGRILFEQQKNRDGDEGSMSVIYGEWAGLPQDRADRYRDYRYSLSKKEYVAAGSSGSGDEAEDLFEQDDEETATAEEADAGKDSVKLVKFTMRVYRVSTPGEALITLSRYLRPPDVAGSR